MDFPDEIKEWLNGSSFILAQGGANPNRYIENIIEAILHVQKPKLIVVGPYSESFKESLKQKYGHLFQQFVYFTGLYPQMQLVRFIDRALASIVLYNDSTPNSLLCASNRMYQSVIRGTPVIVGSNPPMANFASYNQVGIVLESDGRDEECIISGINKLYNNSHFKKGHGLDRSIRWESQRDTIQNILE